jgi:hypothetical protein
MHDNLKVSKERLVHVNTKISLKCHDCGKVGHKSSRLLENCWIENHKHDKKWKV